MQSNDAYHLESIQEESNFEQTIVRRRSFSSSLNGKNLVVKDHSSSIIKNAEKNIFDSGEQDLQLNQQFYNRISTFSKQNKPQKKVRNINLAAIPQPDTDLKWPLFKINNNLIIKEFWTRKVQKDHERVWIKKGEEFIFSGNMLRIGKKKKALKGYYYRISEAGMLMYFKKESDSYPKGFLQLNFKIRATLNIQKTKKNHQVAVIFLERVQGIGITIFDHQLDQTMKLFDALKDFCLVKGFDNVYQQMEILGRGSFASVYKVKRTHDNEIFAAKTYFQETYESNQHKEKFLKNQQMVYNEIQVLKLVQHPGMIEMFEIFQEKDKLVIILEFVPGGTLYQLVRGKKKLQEKHFATLLKNIIESLQKMHLEKFVHRDLKLENVMLESKDTLQTKLVDFGFAEKINEKELVSKAGTPGFIPPEIFKLQPYTAKGDIFSVGVIFYTMISGTAPFKAPNVQSIIELNKKCSISFDKPAWQDISLECKQVIKKMLEARPSERYSSVEILESVWMASFQRLNGRQVQSDFDAKYMQSIRSIYQTELSKVIMILITDCKGTSKEFQGDFSYGTADLKSLYQKNSLKTVNSQKSNDCLTSRLKTSQILQQRSVSAHQQRLPNNQFRSSIQDQQVQKLDENDSQTQNSNKMDLQSFGDPKQQIISSKSLTIGDDFEALDLCNIQFLKMSQNVFNQPKKPIFISQSDRYKTSSISQKQKYRETFN